MRTVNLASATQQIGPLASPFLYYRGFSVRESSGAAAALLRVWDSNATLGATGNVLDEVALTAGQSVRENYGVAKIAKIGVYTQIVSGAIVGSINID